MPLLHFSWTPFRPKTLQIVLNLAKNWPETVTKHVLCVGVLHNLVAREAVFLSQLF